MLQFLRKKENIKKIMWGVAILIVPAFVLWGSGSAVRSKETPKYAGEIFSRKVSFSEYESAQRATRNHMLLIYGDNFKNIVKFLDLDELAWERLILLHQAEQEGIKVNNQEVIGFIKQLPFFQEAGRFAQQRYNIVLEYAFRTEPREFEEQLRTTLAIDKLKDKLLSQVQASEDEIKQAYREENEKAKGRYVFIDPNQFKAGIHPGYEQLQDYYENNKSRFAKPEQVNVEYVALYLEQERPQVTISEQEIQDYYQEHLKEFAGEDAQGEEITKPLAEVEAQIKETLLNIKTKQALEDKLWQLSDQIAERPESFAEIVKDNQLELKETGFFGPQQVIPEVGLSYEFLNAAFSLNTGEISNVLETPKGYFIIKIKGKKESQIPPLEEIKPEVEKALITEQSWKLAEQHGQELVAQIQELTQQGELNFAQAAESLSLTVNTAAGFTRTSYISGIGQSPQFAQAAFALKKGEVSKLITVPNGYCILSLEAITPIDEEKFSREGQEFAQGFLNQKKERVVERWLARLKQEANLVDNIKRLKDTTPP